MYRSDLLRLMPYLLRVAGQDELGPKVNAEPVHGCVGIIASQTHGFVNVMIGMVLLGGGNPVPPAGLLDVTWTFARLHVASLEDAIYGGVREDDHVRRVPDLPTTWSSLVTIASFFWMLVMDSPGSESQPVPPLSLRTLLPVQSMAPEAL